MFDLPNNEIKKKGLRASGVNVTGPTGGPVLIELSNYVFEPLREIGTWPEADIQRRH